MAAYNVVSYVVAFVRSVAAEGAVDVSETYRAFAAFLAPAFAATKEGAGDAPAGSALVQGTAHVLLSIMQTGGAA